MAHSFSFNDIPFSGATYAVTKLRGLIPWAPGVRAEITEFARQDGGVVAPSSYGVRSIEFLGLVQASGYSDLITHLDAIALALNERADCKLEFDEISDRYWMARFTGMSATPVSKDCAEITFQFLAADPHAFAATASEDLNNTITNANGQAVTITPAVGGTCQAYPVLVFTSNASIGQVVVVHDTTDDRIEWIGSLTSGDKLRIDCDPRSLLVEECPSGGEYAASMSGVEGRHPYLLPSQSNVLTIYGFTGNFDATWRNRYL